MSFNSLSFIVFFSVVSALYFLLHHQYRWALLLFASCLFYMAFIPEYIFILLVLIVVDYTLAIFMEKSTGKMRVVYLSISLLSNIIFLGFFKYYYFLFNNVHWLAQTFHWRAQLPVLSIILPLGLSFHTFQSMSYTIEVYRKKFPAERHFGIYALYVMFFPQLVAGPIERPQNLIHQFYKPHVFDYNRVLSGLQLMLWGFFKKLVIADRAAVVVDKVFNHVTDYQGPHFVIAVLLFAVQIYCDFSGYSDIAIGAARVLGFKLMNNFDRPYLSQSLGEFWQRWHISLSTWFKDYVYIPLGGNRVSLDRWCVNIMIVFLLSGLWHGASWTFILWGAFHGLSIIIERITKPIFDTFAVWVRLSCIPQFHTLLKIITTFALTCFGWIFFRANSVDDAVYLIKHLGTNFWAIADSNFIRFSLSSESSIGLNKFNIIVLVVAIFFLLWMEIVYGKIGIQAYLISKPRWYRLVFNHMLVCSILFFGFFGNNVFIYFQF